MSFKIVTDSCCDLSAEMIAELELGIAPLSLELDGRAYREGEMTPAELYAHMRNGKLPKTAAVNPDGWAAAIRPALKAGRDVLVLAFASALSYFDGYTSACLPANLLQAQRDYFGAHTYERIDQPRGQFFHTNWTGHGGSTSASTYTV